MTSCLESWPIKYHMRATTILVKHVIMKSILMVLPNTHFICSTNIHEHVSLSGQVMPYMKLRGGVEFVDEIPRTPSGKIVRRALRDKAKAALSKL